LATFGDNPRHRKNPTLNEVGPYGAAWLQAFFSHERPQPPRFVASFTRPAGFSHSAHISRCSVGIIAVRSLANSDSAPFARVVFSDSHSDRVGKTRRRGLCNVARRACGGPWTSEDFAASETRNRTTSACKSTTLDQLLESWSSRIGSAKSQDQGCFLAFSQGNASRAAVAITITAGSCPVCGWLWRYRFTTSTI
jgi:hypothetical protein